MLVILGSLFLLFASRMASQAKEVEMLSTEELQRNQQLISQIYNKPPGSRRERLRQRMERCPHPSFLPLLTFPNGNVEERDHQ